MIQIRRVTVGYRPGEPVFVDAEATLPEGLTLLVGPNGCGKSTLLKVAAGVERPDSGTVEIDGRDPWSDEAAARRGLAYVPEQPDLSPWATIGEVLDLVCALRGVSARQGREALDRVDLASLTDRSVRELSMGQRRRAVLAAAFVGAPRHVLLDEPLEAMDRSARGGVLEWIDGLLEGGASVVVASHDLEPFLSRARRALTVRERRCVADDPLPEEPEPRLTLLERLARGG